MILSDKDLAFAMGLSPRYTPLSHAVLNLGQSALKIEPLEDPDTQIQPASVDLRIGPEIIRFTRGSFGPIYADKGHASSDIDARTVKDFINVRAGEFLLAHTIEKVTLCPWLTARVEGRSSMGRLGLLMHATAGYIDPGFSGHITLEIKNLTPRAIMIPVGFRVCQLVVETMTSAAQRPYGSPSRGSRYQDQTGATAYTGAPE